jgi:glycine cleavage system protein P-like pyridoxal-binding family
MLFKYGFWFIKSSAGATNNLSANKCGYEVLLLNYAQCGNFALASLRGFQVERVDQELIYGSGN